MSGRCSRKTTAVGEGHPGTRWSAALALAAATLLASRPAFASIFAGEALDKAADVIAIVVLIVVPVVVVVVFWLVHILPEKVAEKRNHPQKDAIQVLCLLSLVFGGMLWPIAWILAYTKPVLHKMAYGTDKGEEHGGQPLPAAAPAAHAVGEEIASLRRELDNCVATGAVPDQLQAIRERLLALEQRTAAPQSVNGVG